MSPYVADGTTMPWAYGRPPVAAVLKAKPEDFKVEELLGYEPDHDGSHAWLRLRKTGQNTDWVAKRLADFAGARAVDIGYAGLKDRHAVTTQWFSVDLKGQAMPEWSQWQEEGVEVVDVTRHRRKLRRGQLAGNRFIIRLCDLSEEDASSIEQRVDDVRSGGIPNYFGAQRFGRDGGNVDAARAMFEGQRVRGRHLKGLYLSAARSYLFNQVLAARVTDRTWNRVLPGEAIIGEGASRAFPHSRSREAAEERLERAVRELAMHPTGPMWGRGLSISRGFAGAFEGRLLADEEVLRNGLERAGLEQERRALRLVAQDLEVLREGSDTVVSFSLPAGAYATSVLREIVGSDDLVAG